MLKKIIFYNEGDSYIINVIKGKLTIVYQNKKVKKLSISDLYYEDTYIGFMDEYKLMYNFDDVKLTYVIKKS